jgi:SAM-dependent methyltransferase
MASIGQITPRAINRIFCQVYAELHQFAPPAIKNAPDRIARLRGCLDHKHLAAQHHNFRLLDAAQRSMLPVGKALNSAQLADLLLKSPGNYLREPGDYFPIELTLRLLRKNKRNLNGLQLAANFGPYLLYLREQRGFTNFLGLDIDQHAVAYAREIGSPVIEGNAAKLPFAGKSLDLVISDHFLSLDYDPLGDSASQPLPDFIGSVAGEVYRVLKPGGSFISLDEDVHLIPSSPFSPPQEYSAAAIAEFSGLKDLRVFQK